jgi:pimeloyl-ACP methyl ester carboxylesterase
MRSSFCVAVAFAIVACGSGDPPSAPPPTSAGPDAGAPTTSARFESGPCPTPLPAGLVDGTTARCGRLVVPEDRRLGTDKTLSLSVLIVRGVEQPAADPIVHLIGGPGGSYEAYAGVLGGEFGLGTSRRTGRDLILFDQRGTGRSNPRLACRSTEAPARCFSRLSAEGIDLAAYDTEQSAADVEDLRLALGYERINLYGQSYGTVLAQTVMRLYPASIRAAVLESVSSIPHDAYLTNSAKALSLALDRIFAECAADPDCRAAFPDPGADLATALAKATDGARQRSLVEALVSLTQFARGTSYVPFALRAFATEDAAALDGLAKVQAENDSFAENAQAGFALGMFLAVSCHDYRPLLTPARDETVNGGAPAAFRAVLGDPLAEICTSLPPSRISPAQRAPFESTIPTLLLSGTHDSNTPLEIAEALSRSLPSARRVAVPGWGHVLLAQNEPCTTEIVRRFLEDPSRAIETTCTKPPVFARSAP